MTGARDMLTHEGTVTVDGAPFARYALETAGEPWKFYGAYHVVHISPVLERQGDDRWFERHEMVRATIHAHLGRQN